MKLNPFSKKTSGYYVKLQAECADAARELAAVTAAFTAAEADLEAQVQACRAVESRRPGALYLSEAESELRTLRSKADRVVSELRHQVDLTERKHRALQAMVDAPAHLELQRKEISRLLQQRQSLQADGDKTDALIHRIETRISAVEQQIAEATQVASQTLVETEGEFVMPEALTRLDVELRVAQSTLTTLQQKRAEGQAALAAVPAQLRDAERLFQFHRAKVTEIELREQLPHWLDVIARATVAAHECNAARTRNEYVIELPSDLVAATTAKLAAEMPIT